MISAKKFCEKIKDVKIGDILAIFKLIIAYPLSKIVKLKHKDLWLICEDGVGACDNGYAFYKYIIKEHPEQEVMYAIDKKSSDYNKVKDMGKIIQFGSLKHWIYYLAASQNISSQKSGKPNAALCYVLEVGGLWKNSRIFLQHGITINDSKWIYYPETKFSLFLCGAQPEYDFVEGKFLYPRGYVQYTGFPRFDELHNVKVNKKRILVMPTWRNWLKLKSKNEGGKIPEFVESTYYKYWNDFLNNKELQDILEEYDLELIFYPHRNMQQYIEFFKGYSKRIVIANKEKYDIQTLLKTSALMITDYSSVFFDFFYMKKPIIFYQFDELEYRKNQLQVGWFDYANNPISVRVTEEKDVIEALKMSIENKFEISEHQYQAHRWCFPLYDMENSERVFQTIKNDNYKI